MHLTEYLRKDSSFKVFKMSIRGVTQLTKLTVRYCRHSGSSVGVREHLQDKLIDWCNQHPMVNVSAEVKSGRHPVLVAKYLNGKERVVGVKNLSAAEVDKHMTLLRNSIGLKTTGRGLKNRLNRPVISSRPSIQGVWTDDVAVELMNSKFEVTHVDKD